MPAWWLGPDLSVSTSSTRIASAAAPVFSAVTLPKDPSSALRLDEVLPQQEHGVGIALDGHPLARCADDASLVFFLESLLTHLATHGNRSSLVVHAGLVRWRDRTIMLPGERGSGKSTTSLWLSRRGGEYLGDDLCFVEPETLTVRGLAKAATLKRGSFALYPESTTFTDPLRGPVRYFLPPRIRPLDAAPVHIDRIVFPRYEPDAPTRAEPVSRPLAALALIQQSYGGGEWGERALRMAGRIAERPAHLIRYRNLDEFESALEALPE